MIRDERYTDPQLKYRPQTLDEIVGHKPVIRSLKGLLKTKELPHSLIFAGPSGVGKTTIARILARELQPKSVVASYTEIDAANNTGVDAMRELTESLNYASITGNSGLKFIILDEAHELSKNAFDALLKPLEDTPQHVYIALCTTEPNKIPKTIQTRCHMYLLREVEVDDIVELLEYIRREESMRIPEKALVTIARESFGSVRQAIVYLSQCRNCKTTEAVDELLASPENSGDIKELCQFIAKGSTNWSQAVTILKRVRSMNPESIRILVANYLTACVLNAKSDRQSMAFLTKLQNFSKPIYSKQAFYEIVLNVADCVLDK